jgi:hypothetical protein
MPARKNYPIFNMPKKKNGRRKRPAVKPKDAVQKQNQFRTEIKKIESALVSTSLTHNVAGPTTGLKNSATLCPTSFNAGIKQGTGEGELLGSWMTYRYPLKLKLTIDFGSLNLSNPDAVQGLPLYYYQGYVATSFARENVTPSLAAAQTIVKRELYDSGLESDHLNFRRMSNNVKIFRRGRIYPDFNARIGDYTTADAAGTASYQKTAPPKNMTFGWSLPKNKQKLIKHTTNHFQENVNMVPFLVITNPNATTNTGTLEMGSIDAFWYSDQ